MPLQRPSPVELITSGGSPLLNDTVTAPRSNGSPQSSTTRISSALGQAAVTAKADPSVVNTGTSLAGVHPSSSGVTAALKADAVLPGTGGITSATATRR